MSNDVFLHDFPAKNQVGHVSSCFWLDWGGKSSVPHFFGPFIFCSCLAARDVLILSPRPSPAMSSTRS